MKTLSSEQLLELSRTEKNSRKRIRLLAIAHFVDGHNRAEIARTLKVARRSVNVWVSNYLNDGLEGLETKKQKGRESYLTTGQQTELATYIQHCCESDAGGRLTGAELQQYIQKHYGQSYHLSSIYKLLSKLGFSWITSRSRHPKQSQATQDAFKKLPAGNDPSHSG